MVNSRAGQKGYRPELSQARRNSRAVPVLRIAATAPTLPARCTQLRAAEFSRNGDISAKETRQFAGGAKRVQARIIASTAKFARSPRFADCGDSANAPSTLTQLRRRNFRNGDISAQETRQFAGGAKRVQARIIASTAKFARSPRFANCGVALHCDSQRQSSQHARTLAEVRRQDFRHFNVSAQQPRNFAPDHFQQR